MPINVFIDARGFEHLKEAKTVYVGNIKKFALWAGETLNLVGYVIGFFKPKIAVFINTGGFILASSTSLLQRKEHCSTIKDLTSKAQILNEAIPWVINHELSFQKSHSPISTIETCGTEKKCYGASSTVLIISSLFQTATATCQTIAAFSNASRSTKQILTSIGAVTGVVAIALPKIAGHYYNRNQEREKLTVAKYFGAAFALSAIDSSFTVTLKPVTNTIIAASTTNPEDLRQRVLSPTSRK